LAIVIAAYPVSVLACDAIACHWPFRLRNVSVKRRRAVIRLPLASPLRPTANNGHVAEQDDAHIIYR
jgi:hypothetical protein